MLLKQIIAPEQINMSFAFTYIKSQAKQFSALWDLLSFSPSVFLAFSVFHSRLNLFVGFRDCQYLYWNWEYL